MPPVIARRYRPQKFEEMIGQEPIVRTLRNAITSGRVAHGFIFSGHRGIGKTTSARILAKALNCQKASGPTPEPCGECDSCREIRDGNSLDVIEIDAASTRGIDEIRTLREQVRFRPARDRYKFFILDEAHQLTGDAFNALLKTLEEPPEWAVFVLATTEPEALPATIRSRCQHYAFRAVNYPVLLAHLSDICRREGVAAEEEALGLIAEAGEGSVRDALSLLDQAITHAEVAKGEGTGITAESVRGLLGRVAAPQLRGVYEQIAADSSRETLAAVDALLGTGVGPAHLAWQLARLVRNALMAQAAPELLETTESERAAATDVAAWFKEEELTRFLQILLRASADLRYGQQERLHLELALLKMLHARRLSSVEDVLAALGGKETPAPAPRPAARTAPLVPAAAAAPTAAPAADDPTAAVLRTLEVQGKKSVASIIRRAEWRWQDNRVELVFGAGAASLAGLVESAETRKALAAACRAALDRNIEVSVSTGGGGGEVATPSEAAPAGSGDSPEERAARHPLLQQIRQTIPAHVLRTRALEPER